MRIEVETGLKKGKRATAVPEEGEGRRCPALLRSLLLAHQIRGILETGQAKNLAQVAGWLGYTAPRIYQTMNLLLLAPTIQQEILRLAEEPHPALNEHLIRLVPLEPHWEKQEAMWKALTFGKDGGSE